MITLRIHSYWWNTVQWHDLSGAILEYCFFLGEAGEAMSHVKQLVWSYIPVWMPHHIRAWAFCGVSLLRELNDSHWNNRTYVIVVGIAVRMNMAKCRCGTFVWKMTTAATGHSFDGWQHALEWWSRSIKLINGWCAMLAVCNKAKAIQIEKCVTWDTQQIENVTMWLQRNASSSANMRVSYPHYCMQFSNMPAVGSFHTVLLKSDGTAAAFGTNVVSYTHLTLPTILRV